MEAAVLDEAWAVVDGRAPTDVYVARGHPVPGRAWLNALAQPLSQPGNLAAVAVGHEPPRPAGSWASAVSDIAAQLGRIDETEAAAIQAALFVPAELELLAGRAEPTQSGCPPLSGSKRSEVILINRRPTLSAAHRTGPIIRPGRGEKAQP